MSKRLAPGLWLLRRVAQVSRPVSPPYLAALPSRAREQAVCGPMVPMAITRRTLLQAAGVSPLMGQPDSKGSSNNRIQVGMIGTGARAQELMQALLSLP